MFEVSSLTFLLEKIIEREGKRKVYGIQRLFRKSPNFITGILNYGEGESNIYKKY